MKQFLFFSLFFLCNPLFSQIDTLSTEPIIDTTSNDSLRIKTRNGEYADEYNALKSAVLPGWGQVVNKQPVKAALFLGTVGAGVYTTSQYRKEFKKFDDAYALRLQNYDNPTDDYQHLDLTELADMRQQTRSDKDIATGATAYVYVVNLIDAAVQYKLQHEEPKEHSATKAAYYSAILPGLGQIYNKKYWKVPLVYAALGASVYISINNRNYHRDYQRELEFRSVGETTGFRTSIQDISRLEDQLEYWRKWRDIAYVSTGAVYLLNVLDATVDAHLYDFNVDEDLGFHPSPVIDQVNGNFYYGINLTFNLTQAKNEDSITRLR